MSLKSSKFATVLLSSLLVFSSTSTAVLAEDNPPAEEGEKTVENNNTEEVEQEEAAPEEEKPSEEKPAEETEEQPVEEEKPAEEDKPETEEPTETTDVQEGEPGAHVNKDDASPSGYTVDFVYDGTNSEKEIRKVEVSGPFNYTRAYNDANASKESYTPYQYENGMYASNFHPDKTMADPDGWGFTAELTDEDNDKIYEVKFPITSGSFGYHYIVTYTDNTSVSIEDPANPANVDGKMNVNGLEHSGDTNTSVVKGHWDPVKQSESPNMDYVLPSSNAGTITYVPYTAINGETAYIGVYTPAGYDENRAEPYKTIYISHGAGGDETDWFHMGSANDIMDNLSNDGETEPAIIVTMDNTQLRWNASVTLPNIVERIIPFMEKNYNVSKDARDRAMVGLSAGGATTTNMFWNYPSEFGYFAMFSGSSLPDSGVEWKADYAKPTVMVTVGTTDFASSRSSGNESSFSSERLDRWCQENIPDTYKSANDIYIKGSHDWFEWPQSFAKFLKETAWRTPQGNARKVNAPAGVTVTSNPDTSSDSHYLATFSYDDTDDRNAVKVTVSGNMQWYKWDETKNFVGMGDTSSIPSYDAYHYTKDMFNAGFGLNGMAEYELTETEGEHFETSVPLPGNLYYYDYTVTYADGTKQTMEDPANKPKANEANGHDPNHSLFYAGSAEDTAEGQEYVYPRSDKQGTYSFVTYTAVDGTSQPLGVYLPYGYDERKSYKTIYVSHGGGGNENEWMTIGAIPNIMDNLIAEGKTDEAVVVTMDNNYFGWNYDQIGPNVVEHIIPFIESHYAVSKNPLDRAFCGLSMGSMTTNQMAMRYPSVFRYFGSFSGGMENYEKLKSNFKVNQLNQDVLFLTAGQIDMARNNKLGISVEDFIKMYDEIGVNYDYKVYGGAHDWGFWRQSFTVFAKDYLWKLDHKSSDKPSEDKPSVKPDDKPSDQPSVKPSKDKPGDNKSDTKKSNTSNTNRNTGKVAGVNTGDGFNVGVFGGMLASCVALAGAVIYLKRKRH